jgi:hypothetical protein
VRRTVRFADVIFTPTHATARVLHEHFGSDLPVQVLQLGAPSEYLRPADAAERRAALGLPGRYVVTTATANEDGRLGWIIDALRADAALPPVVVLRGLDPEPTAAVPLTIPEELAQRIMFVDTDDLSHVGAVLSGASLLLQPQTYIGTGYTLLGALTSAVPVLHSGHDAAEELVIDAGLAAPSAGQFAAEFSRLFRDQRALNHLTVLARDRSRGFGWRGAAWQLWEAHANM